MARRPRKERLPDDLQRIADRLIEQRAEIDPLRLDELKQLALTRSMAHGGRTLTGSRLLGFVTGLALLGGSGGALALTNLDSHPNTQGGAAAAQYSPTKQRKSAKAARCRRLKKHHRHGKHAARCARSSKHHKKVKAKRISRQPTRSSGFTG